MKSAKKYKTIIVLLSIIVLAMFIKISFFQGDNSSPNYACNCPKAPKCPELKCQEKNCIVECIDLIDDVKTLEKKIEVNK